MRPDISLKSLFFLFFLGFFGFFESDVWKGRKGKAEEETLGVFLRLLRMPPSLFILLFMNEVYEVPRSI